MATLPPVNWKDSPNFGAMARGTHGRAGQHIRGWVNHRIVGNLPGAAARFANPDSWASAHFGIGHEDGRLVIHQYVNLADTAWANGDVRDPSWSITQGLPGVNPNLYTVSVEHEDGGTAGRGVVQPDVWAASMQLTRLCVSGDLAAIRAAGIRIGDRPGMTAQDTADWLREIPLGPTGFVDHHQIAGPNKPYCWRPWIDDPGFIPDRRDQLIAYLRNPSDGGLPDTATEDDMTWKEIAEQRGDRIKALEARRDTLLARVAELSTVNTDLAARLRDCEGLSEHRRKRITVLEGRRDSLLTQVSALEDEVEALTALGVPELKATIEQLRSRLKRIRDLATDPSDEP